MSFQPHPTHVVAHRRPLLSSVLHGPYRYAAWCLSCRWRSDWKPSKARADAAGRLHENGSTGQSSEGGRQ
jgi:hypothetical protein